MFIKSVDPSIAFPYLCQAKNTSDGKKQSNSNDGPVGDM